jgi:LmbE family N-acetylglucosaminyl deacetylase
MVVSGTRRLLCVFAHPDDETYGPGGAIARYAREGAEVYLLMFTCGEAGTIGVSKELSRERLCQLRVAELAGACDALGIREHRVLGTPDRGVADIEPVWAVDQIVRDIHKYQPHVLLTFHHKGISGHSDHIAVARYLEQAFDRTADLTQAPAKLYGYGITRRLADLYERPNVVPLEDDEIDAVVEIPDEAMERKLEAIRQHATQYEFYLTQRDKFDYSAEARPEHFHLRKSRLPETDGVADDLFEGIDL